MTSNVGDNAECYQPPPPNHSVAAGENHGLPEGPGGARPMEGTTEEPSPNMQTGLPVPDQQAEPATRAERTDQTVTPTAPYSKIG